MEGFHQIYYFFSGFSHSKEVFAQGIWGQNMKPVDIAWFMQLTKRTEIKTTVSFMSRHSNYGNR